MKSSWTHNLESDYAKEVRGDFLSSRVTRHRLKDLLERDIKSADKAQLNLDYDMTNWAMKQADYIGYVRALHHVISLLED